MLGESGMFGCDSQSTPREEPPPEVHIEKRAGRLGVLVVLRFCVDPGIFRDGRGTAFPALEGRFRA